MVFVYPTGRRSFSDTVRHSDSDSLSVAELRGGKPRHIVKNGTRKDYWTVLKYLFDLGHVEGMEFATPAGQLPESQRRQEKERPVCEYE